MRSPFLAWRPLFLHIPWMAVICLGVARAQVPYANDDLYLYDSFRPVAEENIFKTEGYYNWGTSIIKGKDGKYHLFYARWKKEFQFTGWLVKSEIAHAISDTPAGPWKYRETVLTGRGGGHWDEINAHNPKVKYFDGKYYLYYIATNFGGRAYTENDLLEVAHTGYSHPDWMFLRNNQRTGVAVSESLDGPWERRDEPLIEPGGPITRLTVNPAIARGPDGNYYLIVKGDKPGEQRFIRNQAMAVSASPTGPFQILEHPVIDYLDTEDMSVWYDGGRERFYAIFHATDGFIGLVTSKDGTEWQKATDYVLMPKEYRLNGGSTERPERMERPFIYEEGGEPLVASFAVRKGDESYSVFIPIKKDSFPRPNARQLAWQDAELGVVFHYDLHVFDGKKYGQGHNRIDPVGNHQMFNPEKLDTDQWIQAAKAAGATFAILTATHETGFALYPSDRNPYSVRTLNWRNGTGDVVGDFVASCRKYGLKPGIYLGIRWNSLLGVHDFKVDGTGEFRQNRQKWYNQMVEGMVREICTRYGELFEIWFDGGAGHPDDGAPDVLPIVRQYQPNCLFYHNGQLAEARWGGSESGTVAYPNWATFPYRQTGAGESARKAISENNFQLLKEGDAEGRFWMPAMADAPLRGHKGRHEWFWEPDDETHIFPLEDLMEMYYRSVGQNSTLIIGLTPDPNGLLPLPDVRRLREWGNEIRRRFSTPNGEAIGKDKLEIRFEGTQTVNHVVLQEEIETTGEAIRSYEIQGRSQGRWLTLAKGSSVGHKRIERFAATEVDRLRLRILKSVRKPVVKSFRSYFTEAD